MVEQMDKLTPEQIEALTIYEKDEILMNAIHKTILNVSLEYQISIPQICGCLDIVHSQMQGQYFQARTKK